MDNSNEKDSNSDSRKRRSPSLHHQPEVPLSSEVIEPGPPREEEPPVERPSKRPPAASPPNYRAPAIRKSPPPSSNIRAHHHSAHHAFPATPASNGAVTVGRKSSIGSSRKATSNTVMTTPSSTPGGKAQRGLRHFSIMVCKHVEQMGTTTYNQVADELVSQAIAERDPDGPKGKFDEKNIRRRVYDALNVLLAMDIIAKDKKDIIWRGLPRFGDNPEDDEDQEEDEEDVKQAPPPPPAQTDASQPMYTDAAEYDEHEFAAMQRERDYLEAEVARKQEAMREILVQQVCFRNLVMRNQRREYPQPGGPHKPPPADEKIPTPFIICNTRPSAVVQCDMNKEKTDVMFEFDSPFEINDDNTILKRMAMDRTSVHALQAMLPQDMFEYCHHSGILQSVLTPGEDPNSLARAPHYHAYDRAHPHHHYSY